MQAIGFASLQPCLTLLPAFSQSPQRDINSEIAAGLTRYLWSRKVLLLGPHFFTQLNLRSQQFPVYRQ
jgi:hypothetical protein